MNRHEAEEDCESDDPVEFLEHDDDPSSSSLVPAPAHTGDLSALYDSSVQSPLLLTSLLSSIYLTRHLSFD